MELSHFGCGAQFVNWHVELLRLGAAVYSLQMCVHVDLRFSVYK